MAKINKFKMPAIEESNIPEKEYDFEASFKNVVYTESNQTFSLANLYNYLKSFFSKAMFSFYGNLKNPNSADPLLIEWYEVTTKNEVTTNEESTGE